MPEATVAVIPPLPDRLADPLPPIAVGTAGFLAVTVIAGITGSGFAVSVGVIGLGLGALGLGLFSWQRRAARAGSRTAQQGQGLR